MAELSRAQRLIIKFVPDGMAKSIETESRDWVMDCDCGHITSIWEMGGVRYKAKARGLRRTGKCSACQSTFTSGVRRRT